MLKGYDTRFTDEHIRRLASWFHRYDLAFTVDLVFGGPGETLETAWRTISLMEEIKPALVGMNFGVRVYANTGLGRQVIEKRIPVDGKLFGNIENNQLLYYPVFYVNDLRVGDYLKEVCDHNPKYRLLGYDDFGGVNYKSIQLQGKT